MEEELLQAKQLYEFHLASVHEALTAAPSDASLLEVRDELQAALDSTAAALAEMASTALPPAEALPGATKTSHASSQQPSNPRIHPRSPYARSDPDFPALAARFPALRRFLSSASKKVDFTNPDACREVTRTLLAADFGVKWDLPPGHLVPPVPNRLNYILWLEDLLTLSKPRCVDPGTSLGSGDSEPIRGLDVGCGASLIYPLLGAAACGWQFVGVDVTPEALEWAKRNRAANPHLADLIEVRAARMQPGQAEFLGLLANTPRAAHESDAAAGVLTGAVRDGETFAFTMCNPPFFEDMGEAGGNPATAFGGTKAESAFPGGEAAFVRAMVADSMVLRDRVHWFTTMVGKKATLRAVRQELHSMPCGRAPTVVRTTEFFQGKTSRWGLAWSFAAAPETASLPLQPHLPRGGAPHPPEAASAAAKRQKTGKPAAMKSASLQVAVASPAAAQDILKAVKEQLEAEFGDALRCTVDCAACSLSAEPDGRKEGGSGSGTAWPFSGRLLAQQSKLLVLRLALNKGAPPAAMLWFASVVAAVDAAVRQRWRILD